MNDDLDIDAQLRAGARAFPPAAAPDSTLLRDVLTTSRRRTHRRQGTALACGAVAVAGGASLALRGPAEPERVTLAAPVDETPATTAAPALAVPEQVSEVCDQTWEVDEDGDLVHAQDELPVYVIYGPGWDLDLGRSDTAVLLDGIDLYPTYQRWKDTTVGQGGPIPDGGALPEWVLVTTWDYEDVDVLVMPLVDGEHEITVRTGGDDATLTFVAGPDLGILPPPVDPEAPSVGVARLAAVCDGEQGSSMGATTSVPAPATSPTTPGSQLAPTGGPSAPTTAVPGATTVPVGELAPEDGPTAPTTSTVPPPPSVVTTTAPISVPPTTVP